MELPVAGLVFVVDDDPVNLQTLAEALWEEVFEVAFASDGETALVQIREQKPDVVILDALMPKMSGFQVCEALKADPQTRDIPVLFMTALTDTSDRLRGFAAGAADYLTKPFAHEELRARVKTHLLLRQTLRSLAEKNTALERELVERERAERERAELAAEVIASKEARLAEMATPILPITDRILVMPIIGMVDEQRAAMIMEAALGRATQSGADVIILDVTGLPGADSTVAQALLNTARALRLLGARTILTGIRPDVARTLIENGVNMGEITTQSTLQMGVAHAMRLVKNAR